MTEMVLTAPDGTDLRDSLTRKQKRECASSSARGDALIWLPVGA